ncbi:MAG TPA: hypothetical protein VMC06_03765 [Opitutaceae bacterium]|nr:hypothetical protein [Opitutaceae bacterium]
MATSSPLSPIAEPARPRLSFISTASSEGIQPGKAGLVHHVVAKVVFAIVWFVTIGVYIGAVFLRLQ